MGAILIPFATFNGAGDFANRVDLDFSEDCVCSFFCTFITESFSDIHFFFTETTTVSDIESDVAVSAGLRHDL